MKTKYILIFSLFLLLSGCSGDPYESYNGIWERMETDRHEVMKITNTDGTFLFLDNIFEKKTFTGKEKKPVALEVSDGKLFFNNGFQKIALILSNDKKTIRFTDRTYKRIDEERLTGIKAEIEKEELEYEKKLAEMKMNRKKCDNLRKEFQSQKLKLQQEHNEKGFKYSSNPDNYEKLLDTIKKLESQYEVQRKKIPKCYPGW